MVNYAKYINRNDTQGLQKAIEYSFNKQFREHKENVEHYKVIEKNNNIVNVLGKA